MELKKFYNNIFYDEVREGSLNSAKFIVPIVMDIINPFKVIDIGCGIGTWLSVFKDRGIENILGLDGDYVDRSMLLIPEDKFKPVDLSIPFSIEDDFDLAISLEVAEHLIKEKAGDFIASLCNLAPVILFSAAIPGQGGKNHVNEQWPEYWKNLFAQHDFLMFDIVRPLIWKNQEIEFWYRQNIFFFVKKSFASDHPKFRELQNLDEAEDLILIAPYILQANINDALSEQAGLIKGIKNLPKVVRTLFIQYLQGLSNKRK